MFLNRQPSIGKAESGPNTRGLGVETCSGGAEYPRDDHQNLPSNRRPRSVKEYHQRTEAQARAGHYGGDDKRPQYTLRPPRVQWRRRVPPVGSMYGANKRAKRCFFPLVSSFVNVSQHNLTYTYAVWRTTAWARKRAWWSNWRRQVSSC